MAHKDKRLYNYVVNTLGVSKEVVLEYVKERLEELILKALSTKLESKYVENLIINKITQIVTEGISERTSIYYERESFEKFVKKVVYEVVEKKINSEYTLQLHALVKQPTKEDSMHSSFVKRPVEEKI